MLLFISTDAVAPLTTRPPRIRRGGRKQQRAGGVRRRFGARRFAITLVCHSAERRFGVEREPVVTYARARVCAARRSTTRALPVVAGQRSACVEQCDRECRARGQKKQGIDDLFDTVSDGFFKELPPRLLPILGRETLRSRNTQLYFCAVAFPWRKAAVRARPRTRAGRLIEGPHTIFSLSHREETTMAERSAFLRERINLIKRLP
jgi:hypothetical protein